MNELELPLWNQIFRQCDLESSIALSNTCQAARNAWRDDKCSASYHNTIERVPWLKREDQLWADLALKVVGRTREVVSGDKWRYVTAADPKVGKPKKKATSEFPKTDKTRQAVRNVFEDEYAVRNGVVVRDGMACVGDECVSLMKQDKVSLDLPTPPEKEMITIKSGEEVEKVGENNALMHLRADNKDCVVHVSQKDNITMDMFFENRHTVVKMMHEDGGALMMQHVGDITPYICYIEPTPELKRVVICNIPPAAAKSFQFLFHDGYLVLYFQGRFTRLWVDMGVQKRIHFLSDFRETLGFEKLPQISDTRALTAMPKAYVNNINFEGHYKGVGRPIQGSTDGMSRYVSLYEAKGLVVGDLDDGNCYVATSSDIVIPCVKDNKLSLFALKKTALPAVSNVDIFHVAYEDEETEVIEVDEEEPPVDFSVGKSLENAGNAFFDDTNKFLPRNEVDLISAPFTKAAPGPWDVRGTQKDDNRDWSVKANTVVYVQGRGGGLVSKRATARDVNGKVIKKKPAAKKSREKVFTLGGAAPRRRAPVHDEHDDMTHKYDLFSEGIRDGHKGKRRAKFEPWMEYRMGYDEGVKERKEGL